MTVYRCPLWVPSQPGGIKRLLHLASFALSSLPVMLRHIFWRPDVVWVVEPALFCAPAAVAVARLSGAKAWLHVQDFEVDAAFDLGLLRGKFLRGLVAGAERWLMRRFDVVSTISQRMHQRLLDKGVAPAKARMAVNWVDMAAFSHVIADSIRNPWMPGQARHDSYRAELGIAPDAVVALYSGNMGAKQGLELLAEVAKVIAANRGGCHCGLDPQSRDPSCHCGLDPQSRDPSCHCGLDPQSMTSRLPGSRVEPGMTTPQPGMTTPQPGMTTSQPGMTTSQPGVTSSVPELVFVFCGNGAGRADLVARCQGLGNVRFLDLQPLARLPDLLAMADIHLLPQRADAADLVMPSKLTGMLASARPVVATAKPGTELANVVQGCGLVVPPEDVAAFADALLTLAADPELRERLGAAGFLYAQENLDRDAVLAKFEADLQALF